MDRLFKTAITAVSIALLAGTVGAQDFTLKVSSPTNNDVILKWMETFKENVETESDGQIEVQLFPANQLGQIPATVDGVMFGTIEVTAPASGFFVNIDKRFEVFDVPGLFADLNQAQDVLSDPETLARISSYGEQSGVSIIAAFPHGPLGLLSVEGVRTLGDIEGQKIRVAGPTPLHIAPYVAFGAAPLSMPLGEVLPGMQTGTVDGLLAGVPVYTTGQYYDVAKPLTIVPESYLVVTAVASQFFLDTIGPDLAQIVRSAAHSALPVANDWNDGAVETAFGIWEENGGEIITLSDDEEAAYLETVDSIMPNVFAENPELEAELEFFRGVADRLAQ
jgi:TRAP-type C4-dicarboxylate transport system substrate-binding protein